MRTAVLDRWESAGIIVMAAAVADYHVKSIASEKIKRSGPMSCNSNPILTSSPIWAACVTPRERARRY